MIKCTSKNSNVKLNQHCLKEKCPHESGCGYKYLFNDECEYVRKSKS
jgi:hypothetical protein